MPALDQRARDLLKQGDALFSKRTTLMMLRQEIAQFYYYQKADFTTTRTLGTDYADGVMSTYAYLARQELGNLLPAILRSGEWFAIHAKDMDLDKDQEARKWLEWGTQVQRRGMYDRATAFVPASRETDHDIVTFGDAVLSVDLDLDIMALLYQNHHTRDCAWTENQRREVDGMHRKWKPTARKLEKRFKDVHPDIRTMCAERPESEVDCRHIVVSREDYDYSATGTAKKAPRAKWMSLYIDVEHQYLMEQQPIGWFPYIVPRYMTISGSQYGYSPCVVIPDARSANTLRMVLLEAGEKSIDPPMIGNREIFRDDFNMYAGGMTWADMEADEKLSDHFMYMQPGGTGLTYGVQLEEEIKETIRSSFFLTQITLPDTSGQKTAYEIRKIVEQQLRGQTPLFEPLDYGYSTPICETSFAALKWAGAFGAWRDWPQQLQGADTEFIFQNPLKETADETKAQRFQEGLQLLEMVVPIDPAQTAQIKTTEAFRDALRGLGWPADWLEDEDMVDAARQQIKQKAATSEVANAVGTGANVAEQVGKAGQALQGAGLT